MTSCRFGPSERASHSGRWPSQLLDISHELYIIYGTSESAFLCRRPSASERASAKLQRVPATARLAQGTGQAFRARPADSVQFFSYMETCGIPGASLRLLAAATTAAMAATVVVLGQPTSGNSAARLRRRPRQAGGANSSTAAAADEGVARAQARLRSQARCVHSPGRQCPSCLWPPLGQPGPSSLLQVLERNYLGAR